MSAALPFCAAALAVLAALITFTQVPVDPLNGGFENILGQYVVANSVVISALVIAVALGLSAIAARRASGLGPGRIAGAMLAAGLLIPFALVRLMGYGYWAEMAAIVVLYNVLRDGEGPGILGPIVIVAGGLYLSGLAGLVAGARAGASALRSASARVWLWIAAYASCLAASALGAAFYFAWFPGVSDIAAPLALFLRTALVLAIVVAIGAVLRRRRAARVG